MVKTSMSGWPLLALLGLICCLLTTANAAFCDATWGAARQLLPNGDCMVLTAQSDNYNRWTCGMEGYTGTWFYGLDNADWTAADTFVQANIGGNKVWTGLRCDASCTVKSNWYQRTDHHGGVMPMTAVDRWASNPGGDKQAVMQSGQWKDENTGNNNEYLCRIPKVVPSGLDWGNTDGVISATPVTTDLSQGATTTITGYNFSAFGTPTNLNVQIGWFTCTSPTLVNDTAITCDVPAGTGKNLPIFINSDTYQSRVDESSLVYHVPFTYDPTGSGPPDNYRDYGPYPTMTLSFTSGDPDDYSHALGSCNGHDCFFIDPDGNSDNGGSTDIVVPNAWRDAIDNSVGMTIMFWHKFAPGQENDGSRFDACVWFDGQSEVEFEQAGGAQLRLKAKLRYDNNDPGDTVEHVFTPDNQLHHYVIIAQAGGWRHLLIDGVIVQTDGPNRGTDIRRPDNDVNLLNRGVGNNVASGYFFDFRVYNRAFSPSVIWAERRFMQNTAFSYIDPPLPEVTAHGPVNPTGGMLTLYGQHFYAPVSEVRVDQEDCTAITVVSDTVLTCNLGSVPDGVNNAIYVETTAVLQFVDQLEYFYPFDIPRWSRFGVHANFAYNSGKFGTTQDVRHEFSTQRVQGLWREDPNQCRNGGGCFVMPGPVANAADCADLSITDGLSATMDNRNQLTFMAYWRPDAMPYSGTWTILASSDSTTSTRDLIIRAVNVDGTNYRLEACIDAGGTDCTNDIIQSGSLPWNFNTWRHVIYVADPGSGSFRLYQDDVLVASGDQGAPGGGQQTNFGGWTRLSIMRDNNGNCGSGAFDELRIYYDKAVESKGSDLVFPIFNRPQKQFSITAATSVVNGGGVTTITGTGFGNSAPATLNVKMDNKIDCTAPTWVSDTTLECTMPAGSGEDMVPYITIDGTTRPSVLGATDGFVYHLDDKGEGGNSLQNSFTALAGTLNEDGGNAQRSTTGCYDGGCVTFNQGSGDSGNIVSGTVFITGPTGEASLWFKPLTLQGGGTDSLIRSSNGRLVVEIVWPNQISVHVRMDDNIDFTTTANFTLNTWTHISLRWDDGLVTLRQDGVQIGVGMQTNSSPTYTPTLTLSGTVDIGLGGGSALRHAQVDDIRLLRLSQASEDWSYDYAKPGAFFRYSSDYYFDIGPGPFNIPTNGGSLNLVGTNYPPPAQVSSVSVTIGGSTCSSPSAASTTSVTCTAPAGIGGSKAVVISFTLTSNNAFQNSAFSNLHYNKPTLSAVPTTSTAGAVITISGNNFGSVSNALSVTIATTSCSSATWLSDDALKCTVPGGVGKDKSVVVTVGGQTNAANTLFSYQPPTVASALPSTGTAGGTITLTGTNFGPTSTTVAVTIAGTTCGTPTWLSATLIRCVVPGGVGKAKSSLVTVGGQTNAANTLFSYQPPTVASALPSTPTSGGTITITGTNFGPTSNTVTATVDGAACTSPTWLSSTLIRCVAPVGGSKNMDARVVVGSQTNSANTLFTYQPPTITSISPDSGAVSGGYSVTLQGTNFGAATAIRSNVELSGTVCSSPNFVSHTMVICQIPPGGGSDRVFTVTIGGQGTAGATHQASSSTVKFTYLTPTITSFSPPRLGPNTGGTLTISGANFGTSAQPDLTSFYGDRESPTTTWVSDTQVLMVVQPGVGGNHQLKVGFDPANSTDPVFFSYLAPFITKINPLSGPRTGGSNVLIEGSHFGPTGYTPQIFVGPYPCTNVTRFGLESLRCITSFGEASTEANPHQLILWTGNQSSNPKDFNYYEVSSPECSAIGELSFLKAEREKNALEYFENIAVGRDANDTTDGPVQNNEWEIVDNDRCCSITNINLGYKCGVEFPAASGTAEVIVNLTKPAFVNNMISAWYLPCDNEPKPSYEIWYWADLNQTWVSIATHDTVLSASPCFVIRGDRGPVSLCPDFFQPIVSSAFKLTFNTMLMPAGKGGWNYELETHGIFIDSPYRIIGTFAPPEVDLGPVEMACAAFNVVPDIDFYTKNVLNDTLGSDDVETLSMEARIVDLLGDEVPGLSYIGNSVAVSNGAGTLSNFNVTGLGIGNYQVELYHLNLKVQRLPITILVGAPDRLEVRAGSFVAQYQSLANVDLSAVVIDTKDGCGNVVPSAVYNITVGGLGLSFSGQQTRSTAAGSAAFSDLSISSPAVGTYTVTFTSSPALIGDSRDIEIIPGIAAALVITEPTSISIQAADISPLKTIFTKVTDAGGAQLGSLDPAARTTDITVSPSLNMTGTLSIVVAGGQGSFSSLNVKAPKVGTYTLTLSTTGLASASIPLTITAGLPRKVIATPGSLKLVSVVNTALPKFDIKVVDAGGNLALEPGPTQVRVSIDPATKITGTTQRDTTASVTQFSGLVLDSPVANSYSLLFRAAGLGDGVVTVVVDPGPPIALRVQPKSDLIVEKQADKNVNLGEVTIQAVDAGGTPVPFSGSVTITPKPKARVLDNWSPTLSGTGSSSFAPTGVTFTSLSLNSPKVGESLIEFSAPGLQPVVHRVNIKIGDPHHITLKVPLAVSHNNEEKLDVPPSVVVQDVLNNDIQNLTMNLEIVITPAPATIAGSTAITDEQGIAIFETFGWSGRRAQYYNLQFVDPTRPGVTSPVSKVWVRSCNDILPNSVPVEPRNTVCQCKKGYATIKNDAVVASCEACPPGTYKDSLGDAPCLSCPENRSTNDTLAATDERQCICNPGWYDPEARAQYYANGGGPIIVTPGAGNSTSSSSSNSTATSLGINEYSGKSSIVWRSLSMFHTKGMATLQNTNTSSAPSSGNNTTGSKPSSGSGVTVKTSTLVDCVACPPGAICNGGMSVETKVGFWRSSPSSVTFYDCPDSDVSCKGGDAAACAPGYTGPLCSVCDNNYARFGGECQKCPDNEGLSWLFLALTILAMIGVVVFMVSTANDLNPNQVAQKILLNYMQMIGFAGEFKLRWPPILSSLFGASESASTPSLKLLSIQCVLGLDYFDLAKIYSVLPILGIVLPALVYAVIVPVRRMFSKNRKEKAWKEYLNSTVVAMTVILTLVHPTVTKEMFFGFACVDIDGNQYLAVDMSVSCASSTYKAHRILFGIVLALFSIGLPTLLGFAIHYYRARLDEDEVRRTWGFLYYGYAEHTRHWETAVIFRKTVIVALIVFAALDATVQAYMASWLLFVAVMLHMHFQPFEKRHHFWLESMSLCVTFLSLQAGLLFLREDDNMAQGKGAFVSEEGLVVISMLIVICNASVVLYFLYVFVNTIYIEAREAKRQKMLEEEMNENAGWQPSKEDFLMDPEYYDPRFDPESEHFDPDLAATHMPHLTQKYNPSANGGVNDSWYSWVLNPLQAVSGLLPAEGGVGGTDDGYVENDGFAIGPEDVPLENMDDGINSPEVTRQSSQILDGLFDPSDDDEGDVSDGDAGNGEVPRYGSGDGESIAPDATLPALSSDEHHDVDEAQQGEESAYAGGLLAMMSAPSEDSDSQ